MMHPQISIVVAVYKAERYIRRCIDSIITQSYADFELLLIDDGSPDNSGVICDEYAAKDNRVRVFHKENGGVSSARQVGLENAKGQYVIHVDPDDWVDSDMLESLYSKAIQDDADMVICDYYISGKSDIIIKQNISDTNPTKLLSEYLLQNLHASCCNKLVKTKLFADYGISFPQEIIRWEDLWVTCHLLMLPIRISYLPRAFYHYDVEINENSIVNRVTRRGVESQITFCNYFQTKLDAVRYSEELYSCFRATKELMFNSQLYSDKEIVDFGEAYNSRYLEGNNKLNIRYPVPWCVSQLHKGHGFIAHAIYNVYIKVLIPLKNIIKR